MWTLWRSHAKVREVIDLPFGVVSGVGPGTGVLDGGPGPPKGREVLEVWEFSGPLV